MSTKRAPVFLLDDEASSDKGIEHIITNIESLKPIYDTISTTLGPLGRDKLIFKSPEDYFISNDGSTILSSLPITHPVANLLKTVSLAQDSTVGDGTTSVCLLTINLLTQLKPLIIKKMPINLIISTLVEMESFLLKNIQQISLTTTELNKTVPQIAKDCAETSLSSKLISKHSDFFSNLIIQALQSKTSNLNKINYTIAIGGDISESFLFKGITVKKTFSYAGFERQPKLFTNTYIALLEVELELKSERETAEIRISSAEEYSKVVKAEQKLFYGKMEALIKAAELNPDKNEEYKKLGIVLSTMPVGDFATQFFSERGIYCAGRIDKKDLNNLAKNTNALIIPKISTTDLESINKSLGKVIKFEEKKYGNYRYNFIEGISQTFSTIFLRGGNTKFLEEAKRSLNDAVKIASVVLKSEGKILCGAGATEISLAARLRECFSEPENKIETQKKSIYEAAADALEKIPEQLAFNAGFDGIKVIGMLREKERMNKNWGVNLEDGEGFEKLEAVEPVRSKENIVKTIVEAACLILSIDETIKDRPTQKVD